MNRKYLILKTLRSSARLAETEHSRVSIPRLRPVLLSGLNPLLLVLSLSLLSSFTSFAWDDDEEFESKPFHRSNYNQQNSANDYGYKNPYQASSAQRASVIDFGGPKRASQDDDYVAPKGLISPQQQYDADQACFGEVEAGEDF